MPRNLGVGPPLRNLDNITLEEYIAETGGIYDFLRSLRQFAISCGMSWDTEITRMETNVDDKRCSLEKLGF